MHTGSTSSFLPPGIFRSSARVPVLPVLLPHGSAFCAPFRPAFTEDIRLVPTTSDFGRVLRQSGATSGPGHAQETNQRFTPITEKSHSIAPIQNSLPFRLHPLSTHRGLCGSSHLCYATVTHRRITLKSHRIAPMNRPHSNHVPALPLQSSFGHFRPMNSTRQATRATWHSHLRWAVNTWLLAPGSWHFPHPSRFLGIRLPYDGNSPCFDRRDS